MTIIGIDRWLVHERPAIGYPVNQLGQLHPGRLRDAVKSILTKY